MLIELPFIRWIDLDLSNKPIIEMTKQESLERNRNLLNLLPYTILD